MMYFFSDLDEEDIKCSKCSKSLEINVLSLEHGILWEEGPVFSPKNCYIQIGGDYCGSRWVHFFCSSECAYALKHCIPPVEE